MWRSLKNIFYSLWTYSDLSPDLRMRRRVNRVLHHRPCLSAIEWHQTFWQPLNVSRSVSDFVYTQMPKYSGLEFDRVHPGDRLHEDLHLPLVCWFDWELDFCERFLECFGVEPDIDFSQPDLVTLQDLMLLLNCQFAQLPTHSTSSKPAIPP